MKNEIIDRIKQVENKLEKGQELEREDTVFLFALSLIKGKKTTKKDELKKSPRNTL